MTAIKPYSFLTDYHTYDEGLVAVENNAGTANAAIVRTPVLSSGQVARIDTITTRVSPFSATVIRPTVYRGKIAPNNLVATTTDGRGWTITQLNLILRPQDFLTFQLLNLDSGQEIFVKVLGQYLD